MNHLCDPCKSQQKQKTATQWCLQCDECLCQSCIDYHKALTITKDHTIVNKEDRDIVVQFTQSINTKCSEHTHSEMEYYCILHDVSCCRTCRVKTHGNCNDVRQISDFQDTVLDFQSNIKALERNIGFLDTIIDNRNAEIKHLEEDAENFSTEMKRTKAEILSKLKSIESKLQTKFSSGYNAEYQNLQADRDKFIIRQKQLKERRQQLLKIAELKALSKVQRFLGDKTIMAQNEKERKENTSDAQSLTRVSCTYDLSSWQLQIDHSIGFQTLSSHIKLDGNSTKLRESEFPNEKPQKTEIHGLKPSSVQTKEDVKTDIIGSVEQIRFTYKSHFRVLKKELQMTVHSVKIISKENIVLGEVSQSKLYVYNKFGLKLGEVQLLFPPGEITVIDDLTVAVTVNKCVVIADTVKLKIKDMLYMYDKCYGIAFTNGNFIVNCESRGLIMISSKGELLSKFPLTNAILHLCIYNENIIASIKSVSNLVHFVNIKTKQVTTNQCTCLFRAAGITSDNDGNIFVICHESHTVYMYRADKEGWEPILNAKDNIYKPTGIDYDTKTDTLYVINNGGTSVYIYSRNKTTKA